MKQLLGYEAKGKSSRADMLYGEAMRKYGNLGEDALISKLMEMVQEQKRNGTFDEVQLLGFVNTVSPHLNSQQRAKLESLLGML
ncbi:MAG: hypothetical protein HFE36_00820 [Clostridia bacterium]|nr:hypothetical protein [Clostridia bacterium]